MRRPLPLPPGPSTAASASRAPSAVDSSSPIAPPGQGSPAPASSPGCASTASCSCANLRRAPRSVQAALVQVSNQNCNQRTQAYAEATQFHKGCRVTSDLRSIDIDSSSRLRFAKSSNITYRLGLPLETQDTTLSRRLQLAGGAHRREKATSATACQARTSAPCAVPATAKALERCAKPSACRHASCSTAAEPAFACAAATLCLHTSARARVRDGQTGLSERQASCTDPFDKLGGETFNFHRVIVLRAPCESSFGCRHFENAAQRLTCRAAPQ